jgi:hypothetical protein
MNDTELLVHDGELHYFKLTITDKQEASVSGHVQKVLEWRDNNKPYSFEDYFTFTIKWDGDLHVEFVDRGALTLFGPLEVVYHSRLMVELYQWAQREVPIEQDEWIENL